MAPESLMFCTKISNFSPLTSETLQLCSTPYFRAYNLHNAHKMHYIQKQTRQRVQNLGNGDLK